MSEAAPSNLRQFDFDSEFQYRLCVLLCTDVSVLMRFRHLIRPEYFTNEIARQLVAWSYALYDAYHIAPTRASLLDTASADAARRQSADIDLINRWIESLYYAEVSDREYILERVSQFCTIQEYTLAVIDAATRIKEQRDVERIPEIIRAAETRLSVQHGDLGLFLLGMDGPSRFEAIFSNPARVTVPTPWPTLNEWTGGIGRKELFTFLAHPNVGKSFCLTNVSTAAACVGWYVVHVTLEMSQVITSLRVYAKLSGQEVETLRHNPYSLDRIVGPFHQQGGEVLCKEFPTSGITINELRDFVLRVGVMTGRMPDMLVVDYADLLRSDSSKRDRHDIDVADLYKGLRGLAIEYNMAVVTASQATRKSLGKERVTMADLAESFQKAAISDIIVALCQTEEEETASTARFFIAKNRNERRGGMLPLFLQYNIATISERQHQTAPPPSANLGTFSQFLPNQLQGDANGSAQGNPPQQ